MFCLFFVCCILFVFMVLIIPEWLFEVPRHIAILFWWFLDLSKIGQRSNMDPQTPYVSPKHFKKYKVQSEWHRSEIGTAPTWNISGTEVELKWQRHWTLVTAAWESWFVVVSTYNWNPEGWDMQNNIFEVSPITFLYFLRFFGIFKSTNQGL